MLITKPNSSIIFVILFFFLYTTLSAQEFPSQNTKSEINAVTVFLNNAEISRTTSIQIPEGKSDVIFTNLSARILDKGIKISTSKNVKVYAVVIEKNPTYYLSTPAYKSISDTLDQAIDKRERILVNLETLNKQMLFLESNMKVSGNSGLNFSQLNEAETFFNKKIKTIQDQIFIEKEKLKEAEKKVSIISGKQKKIRLKEGKASAGLRVTFLCDQATTTDVEIRYLVSKALWKPLYAFRANEGTDNITIDYQAQLYNDTGEDWNNKPITLAILDSSNDIDKPELETWDIEEYGNNRSKKRKSTNARSYPIHDINPNKANKLAYDELAIDDLSTRFELQDLHKIPSDASPHLIDVISYQKEVEFYNLSIPKVKNGAYLIARIKNWENLGLIDGRANLYFNNSYQGYSNLQTQQLTDTLDISLGKENAFTISRKKLSSRSRKSLIGFNIKEVLTYEIIIKNNKNESQEIIVKDQIPISTSKDVEIKTVSLSNGKLKPLNGDVTWKLKLKPNETRKLYLKFNIKYPKSKKNKIKYNTRVISTPRYF